MEDNFPENSRFFYAAQDLRFLLGRDYPRPGALTFVGNRYQLAKDLRDILNRGVYPDGEAAARRSKLLAPDRIRGRGVGIDGHNVLITLESALLGRTLVECDDGLIRDTAGLHGSYRPSEATETAIDLIVDFLIKQGVKGVLFLLDAPLTFSGETAAQVNAVLAGRGLMGRARAVPIPEMELNVFSGPVATSDSVLIDQVPEPFDLAGWIIREIIPPEALMRLRPSVGFRNGGKVA
ncbi:MAG: DUF434 domain-containing protein [Pseudomonadota bacterium]